MGDTGPAETRSQPDQSQMYRVAVIAGPVRKFTQRERDAGEWQLDVSDSDAPVSLRDAVEATLGMLTTAEAAKCAVLAKAAGLAVVDWVIGREHHDANIVVPVEHAPYGDLGWYAFCHVDDAGKMGVRIVRSFAYASDVDQEIAWVRSFDEARSVVVDDISFLLRGSVAEIRRDLGQNVTPWDTLGNAEKCAIFDGLNDYDWDYCSDPSGTLFHHFDRVMSTGLTIEDITWEHGPDHPTPGTVSLTFDLCDNKYAVIQGDMWVMLSDVGIDGRVAVPDRDRGRSL